MNRTVVLGWVFVGVMLFGGVAAAVPTTTVTTNATAQMETTNTTMPQTTSHTATTRHDHETTEGNTRNASNVTVQINSTSLSGDNCSVSVATRGNVTIPIAKSGNETVETANVSAAWLVYTNRVERVNERVNERLPEWVSNTSTVRSTGIGGSNNTTVQGESTLMVFVGVAPGEVSEIRNEIPHQIDCVEIAIEPTAGGASGAAGMSDAVESTGLTATVGTTEGASPAGTEAVETAEFTPSESSDATAESATSSSTGPGFGVGAAVVAVCAVVFVRRRR